jgi:hypothetical protein
MQKVARGWDARRAHRPSDVYLEAVPGRDPASCYQHQFHRSDHIIRAMALGNGSGKTTAAGVEADWWLQHRHPYLEVPESSIQVLWVCLKFQQMDMLREQLETVCLTRGWAWNDTKHKYSWPNGSSLHVLSNDGDWGSIQGVNPDLVIIDEECDEKLWRELQMRRRVRKKTKYVVAATATKGKRWLYKDVFAPWLEHHKAAGKGELQAMAAQAHPTIWMWSRGGIEDNPYADDGDKQWYSTGVKYGSAAEKQVRRHGGFADFNASPVFDHDGLDDIEAWMQRDPRKGLDGELQVLPAEKWKSPTRPMYQFIPTRATWKGGRITLFERPTDDFYVIGADFSQGLEAGDAQTAVVCRRGDDGNCYQVAEAEGNWDAAPFTFVLFALGWYYNQALIVGEANAMGMPALRRLYTEMGYSYIYTRATNDQKKFKRKSDLLGYHKGANSLMIRRLQWAIAPSNTETGDRLPPRFFPRSPFLLDQLRRYQLMPRSESKDLQDTPENNLIMGAPRGYRDDLVSGAAGAIEGWFELPRFPKPEPKIAPGSAADVLGHAEILNPPKRKSAFSQAKR